MSKLQTKKWIKRLTRIAALAIGAGLVAPSAGNALGLNFINSLIFGATFVVLGVAATLLLVYASKGDVPDQDFDKAINDQIETIRADKDNKK